MSISVRFHLPQILMLPLSPMLSLSDRTDRNAALTDCISASILVYSACGKGIMTRLS